MDQQTQSVNIIKYLYLFTVFYIIISLVAGFIFQYFELERNFGISIGILVASAMLVSSKFVADENRAPAKSEKHKLIWGSIVISFAASMVGLLLIAISEDIPVEQVFGIFAQVPILFLLIGILLVMSAYWLILFLCYGSGAKKIAGSKKTDLDSLS